MSGSGTERRQRGRGRRREPRLMEYSFGSLCQSMKKCPLNQTQARVYASVFSALVGFSRNVLYTSPFLISSYLYLLSISPSHTYMHVHMHTHSHMYARVHTHTHTHTHTHSPLQFFNAFVMTMLFPFLPFMIQFLLPDVEEAAIGQSGHT